LRVYPAKEKEVEPDAPGRTHPWETSVRSEKEKYYDFVTHPELIETSLEDFIAWSNYEAIQTFYKFLRWVNGSDSMFETNDSAFSGIEKNTDDWVPKKLRASGRVMMFFRKPELNLLTATSQSLMFGLYQGLKDVDKTFELGVIGLAKFPTHFSNANVLDALREGSVLALYFWSWGDTNEETMNNLNRLFSNVHSVTQRYSRIVQGLQNLVITISME
jgi:hypothetical protein